MYKSEKLDSIFSLFMMLFVFLKELDDFDGVLAHVLGGLHPAELLQASLDLSQLWHQLHLRNKTPPSDDCLLALE